jgi:hypothetical protein
MTSTVPQSSFDSDIHLKDLNWNSIGVVPNSGSANLVVPGIVGKLLDLVFSFLFFAWVFKYFYVFF